MFKSEEQGIRGQKEREKDPHLHPRRGDSQKNGSEGDSEGVKAVKTEIMPTHKYEKRPCQFGRFAVQNNSNNNNKLKNNHICAQTKTLPRNS